MAVSDVIVQQSPRSFMRIAYDVVRAEISLEKLAVLFFFRREKKNIHRANKAGFYSLELTREWISIHEIKQCAIVVLGKNQTALKQHKHKGEEKPHIAST